MWSFEDFLKHWNVLTFKSSYSQTALNVKRLKCIGFFLLKDTKVEYSRVGTLSFSPFFIARKLGDTINKSTLPYNDRKQSMWDKLYKQKAVEWKEIEFFSVSKETHIFLRQTNLKKT